MSVSVAERGTIDAPGRSWRILRKEVVEIEPTGACLSEGERTWRRRPGGFVGEENGLKIEVDADEAGRPLSWTEVYATATGESVYARRWRVERDAEGRIARLDDQAGTLSKEPAWPVWDDSAWVYRRIGTEAVLLQTTRQSVQMLFQVVRGAAGPIRAVSIFSPDVGAAARARCPADDPAADECMEQAEKDTSADPVLDVSIARVVDWDDSGTKPTRVIWLPGELGDAVAVDARFFSGDERLVYDRQGRLVQHSYEWRGETDRPVRPGRRSTYSYSASCEGVARDWSRDPAACPVQLDRDLWLGWPAL